MRAGASSAAVAAQPPPFEYHNPFACRTIESPQAIEALCWRNAQERALRVDGVVLQSLRASKQNEYLEAEKRLWQQLAAAKEASAQAAAEAAAAMAAAPEAVEATAAAPEAAEEAAAAPEAVEETAAAPEAVEATAAAPEAVEAAAAEGLPACAEGSHAPAERHAAASAAHERTKVRPTRERKRAMPFGTGLEALGDKERKRVNEGVQAVCL